MIEPPTQGCPPLEVLAAFVDGRLAGDERAQMVEHLADCERCYEVYTETVRFQEEEDVGGDVVEFAAPNEPVRRKAQVWLPWAALAAAVLGALLVWTPALDLLSGRGVLTADLPVATLGKHLQGAEADPFDATGWSYARSGNGGFALGLNERERSFRLGVRLVDLEVALRQGDKEQALARIPELTDLADSFEVTEHITYSYKWLEEKLEAGEAPQTLLKVSGQTAGFLEDIADPDYLALGKWAEAGRLAAEAGDVRFLANKAVRKFQLASATQLSADAYDTYAALSDLLAEKVVAEDLPALQQHFAALVSQVGNL